MSTERPVACDLRKPGADREKMLRFIGVFFGLVFAFYALTLLPWVDANILFPVMKASARGSSVLLNLVGARTITEGVVVRGPSYAVAVQRGCDPLEPIVFFTAGLMAFPAAWRRRFAGLAVGGTFLFFLNLVRIATLYLLGASHSSQLEAFHLWWWPAFFIVCALALWVLWLLWIRRLGMRSKSVASGNPPDLKPRTPLPGAGL